MYCRPISASYSLCTSNNSGNNSNNSNSSRSPSSNSSSSNHNINSSSFLRVIVGLIVILGLAGSSPSSLVEGEPSLGICLLPRLSFISGNSRPGYNNKLNNNHSSVKLLRSRQVVQLAAILVSRVLRAVHVLHRTQHTHHLHHAARSSSFSNCNTNTNSNRNHSSRAWTISAR